MMSRLKKHRKKWIALFTIVLFLIGFRLYLPTLAKNYANRQLNKDPLYHGEISEVKLHLWRGAYSAIGLRLERVEDKKTIPFVSADEVEVGLSWKELLHRAVLAKIRVKNLDLNVVQEQQPGEGGKQIALGRKTKEGKKEEASDWKDTFKNMVPLNVGRLNIEGRSIHFRDLTANPPVHIYLDHVNIVGRNLTNSQKMASSLFGNVDFRGRLMRSGDLNIHLLVNPLVSPPEFKVTTRLKNLDLTKLNEFFTAYGKFDVKSGSFSLYSEMATADNNIKGYVKPLIKNLKVADFKEDKKKGVVHAFWEVIVGAVGGIFKNYPAHQQAAKIAFEGRLDDPQTSNWQVFKSVLHNMFVKPISPSVDKSVKLADVKKGAQKSSS
jgi:hypothetical protein